MTRLERKRAGSHVEIDVSKSTYYPPNERNARPAIRLAVGGNGARLSAEEVEDLIIMLLYYKKLVEDDETGNTG